jgi:hypothetical protein
MIRLQKAGGIAALVEALTYIAGFAVIATLLNPGITDDWSAAQKLAFVLERKAIFQLWTLCIYVLFGIALVVLVVALHARLKDQSFGSLQVATAFGLIWAGLVVASGMVASVGLEAVAGLHARETALAVSTWVAIGVVQDGLGGGVEIVGGLWVLLISLAALRSGQLPRSLNYIGILVGVAGLLTVVPPLGDLGAVFGLGQIVWFAWIGTHMLRHADG